MGLKRLSYDLSAEVLGGRSLEDELIPLRQEEEPAHKTDINAAILSMIDNNLTCKQKCYIILYYREGLTVTQIAKRYGISSASVSRTLRRGRERLAGEISRTALRRIIKGRG